MHKLILAGATSLVLSACGGGGGSPGTCVGSAEVCSPARSAASASGTTLPPPVGEAKFAASTSFANQCQMPRSAGASNAFTGVPYNDSAGSLKTELDWIRSFVNETYLWYDEVPATDLALYGVGATVPFYEPANNAVSQRLLGNGADVTQAFFNSQRTPLSTPSGKPKDRFHFTYPTAEWEALLQTGTSVGYGFEAALLSAAPPRKIVVAFTAPRSVAATNGITRGTELLSVDGVDVVNGSAVDTINEGLFAPVSGKTYTFDILDPGSSTRRTVSLTAGPITLPSVQNVAILPTPTGSVGYLLFNDHIVPAESQLIDAINEFKAADGGTGVRDLVVDLRYNGGGLLRIASQLGYMIAGSTTTQGKVFEQFRFNRKNPFGLDDSSATPFLSVSNANVPLPQLSLARVFVLTSAGTCSASEALINGLRGVGVEVIQIGGTTCGKPYGFFPTENCGTTYFAVQFEGVNHVGFGDYPDGFVPGGTASLATSVPGCAVADDFTRQLGDPLEGRLAAALRYRTDGTCPLAGVTASAKRAGSITVLSDPQLVKSPVRENRWLEPLARPASR